MGHAPSVASNRKVSKIGGERARIQSKFDLVPLLAMDPLGEI